MPFRRGHLRYFVTVAEEGQMTRAAAKLQMAQPALSQAIAQLESVLGFQLLERHARGVTLTAEGEAFLPKARVAVATEQEAVSTALSLARGVRGTLEFGFLGAPPRIHTPALFEALGEKHPDIAVSYRELQFPSSEPASWLNEVDVALSHRPPADAGIWVHVLRSEPRVALVPNSHPLATRGELTVADVLDETFIGFHPSIESWWAGFWSLVDHRGAPPPHVTADRVSNSQEFFVMIAAGRAITTVPACHAELIVRAVSSVVAIPLSDADPSVLVLAGRVDRRNTLVEALITVAESLKAGCAGTRLPAHG
ncbi:MAG TPA: LysR substrate-binding domain-containing protein [Solirubrobacteraceae bacterium]|jgi:DNA-binding transcriptional LysR family regulator|nr:LysR substrate-binding domain-containing protein [Solirubrobacteraceae bacterium]